MLSLEEAITHCLEVAEANEKMIEYDLAYTDEQKEECRECAEEHRQLVELLRELKKLREIPDKLVPKYRDGIQDEYNRGANEMLEEVIDDIRKYMEEINADECSMERYRRNGCD